MILELTGKLFLTIYWYLADDTLSWTKCDATVNDIKDVEIEEFPTLLFYPGNNKKAYIRFDEEEKNENIVLFL